MVPMGVLSGHHEEYWNDSPGARTGCSPTTPGPLTSLTSSAASVMIQCRLINWTVSAPLLVIRTVYWNTHSPCCGCEFSAEYCDNTSTETLFVTASDKGPSCEGGLAMLEAPTYALSPAMASSNRTMKCLARWSTSSFSTLSR